MSEKKKLTTFDKTREALKLPEREYSQGEQSCFNVVAKKLTKGNAQYTAKIVE